MQLDQTRVVVRERSLFEVLDLALHVTRAYWQPCLLLMAVGAVPFALLNWWLIGELAHYEADLYGESSAPIRYFWGMSLLVFVEAPLASVFLTKYLGQSVFEEKPSMTQAIRNVFKMTGRIFWTQGIVRGVVAALVLMAGVEVSSDVPVFEILLFFLVVLVAALRAFRPFMNEIVLLEQNPLWGKGAGMINIGRRSSLLHSLSSGDLFGRWIVSAILAILLALAFANTLMFGLVALFNQWEWSPGLVHVGIPASLWLTAMFISVTRFLSYLDLRIRQEGWEVELRLRAEAARLTSKLL